MRNIFFYKHLYISYNFKVDVEEFVDDYERPVLEKYEKITPTPIEKKKKVHFYTNLATLVYSCYYYNKHIY